MLATHEQQKLIDRQPFATDRLVAFCGTKRLAKKLACDLGDSLLESDRARSCGDCDDTAFELVFWYGGLFIGSDELYDMGVNVESLVDYTVESACDERLDAEFCLCRYRDRRFIVVRYEFQEDECALSAWWLTREEEAKKLHYA